MRAARRLIAGTTCAAALLALPTAASAAPTAAPAAPQLLASLVTAKQFPGYQVVSKPAVVPNTTKTKGCDTADPKGTTTVATVLLSTKKSGAVTRTVGISEQITEFASTAVAKQQYLLSRKVIATCVTDQLKGSAAKVAIKVGSAAVAGGATNAYSFVATVSGSDKANGYTTKIRSTNRSTVYLRGKYVIVINPSRATTTLRGKTISSVGTDDSVTRALGVKVATYSFAALAKATAAA